MSVYGPNTNFANERTYLNNLVSAGGGKAIWAKKQQKKENDQKQKNTFAQHKPNHSTDS